MEDREEAILRGFRHERSLLVHHASDKAEEWSPTLLPIRPDKAST